MQFETSSGRTLTNPSPSQIDVTLASLSGNDPPFAILSKSDQTYVQVLRLAGNRFQLEYRDGSEASHFQAAHPQALEVVQELFRLYASNNPTWHGLVSWQPLGNSSDKGSSIRPLVLASVALLVVLLIVVLLANAA